MIGRHPTPDEIAFGLVSDDRDLFKLRAERWEALARQLGDALTDFASEWEVNEHTNLSGDGGTWADCSACDAPWPCPTEQVRAALSVYRDAIKEDGS